MQKYTSYAVATKWLNTSLILCNDIINVDPAIEFNESCFEDDELKEFFQFFLTNASCDDVEYLEKNFGLSFAYSPLLDCWVLCVDHCGTGWSHVACPISQELADIYGDEILYDGGCNGLTLEHQTSRSLKRC